MPCDFDGKRCPRCDARSRTDGTDRWCESSGCGWATWDCAEDDGRAVQPAIPPPADPAMLPSAMRIGDVVWAVDIAEPHPVRGVVVDAWQGSVAMRLGSGSILIRQSVHATMEDARAAGRLAFDRLIMERRQAIAAAEADIADLERQRDGYGSPCR